MQKMLVRRQKLIWGPYKGRYPKDALCCELGEALLRREDPTVDELLKLGKNAGVPASQIPSRNSVGKWLPAWRNWYRDQCPADLGPYQCSRGDGVIVPVHSRDDADRIRSQLRARA